MALYPESYETDFDFAHTVALTLNKLIDDKIISTKEISNARDEKILEFVSRFESQIKKFLASNKLADSFEDKDIRKIKILFNEPEFLNNRVEREKVINFTREFLRHEQERGLEIEGFLLFGSRIDPNKKPDNLSDIDMIPVLKMSTNQLLYELHLMGGPRLSTVIEDDEEFDRQFEEWSFYADLDSDKKRFCVRNNLPDFQAIPLEVVILINSDLLKKELDLTTTERVPSWGYNPDAVYYVGTLSGMDEGSANNFIQNTLRSDKAMAARKTLLDRIRKGLKN